MIFVRDQGWDHRNAIAIDPGPLQQQPFIPCLFDPTSRDHRGTTKFGIRTISIARFPLLNFDDPRSTLKTCRNRDTYLRSKRMQARMNPRLDLRRTFAYSISNKHQPQGLRGHRAHRVRALPPGRGTGTGAGGLHRRQGLRGPAGAVHRHRDQLRRHPPWPGPVSMCGRPPPTSATTCRIPRCRP